MYSETELTNPTMNYDPSFDNFLEDYLKNKDALSTFDLNYIAYTVSRVKRPLNNKKISTYKSMTEPIDDMKAA